MRGVPEGHLRPIPVWRVQPSTSIDEEAVEPVDVVVARAAASKVVHVLKEVSIRLIPAWLVIHCGVRS